MDSLICLDLRTTVNMNPLFSKSVLGKTVKTQMKCRIIRHFISVYTICYEKKRFSGKEIQFVLELIISDKIQDTRNFI